MTGCPSNGCVRKPTPVKTTKIKIMATRADFYIMDAKGKLELVGCTSNDYDGEFEEAKTAHKFRKEVRIMLNRNNSIEGRWYWPWKNSHISYEVFIFRMDKKEVWCKTYDDTSETQLAIIPMKDRYMNEEGGYNHENIEIIELPLMK